MLWRTVKLRNLLAHARLCGRFAQPDKPAAMQAPRSSPNRLDRIAVVLSGLCLLHCVAVPFALVLGPLMGQWLQRSETQVHWLLLALALPISGVALWRGYRRQGSPWNLSLGSLGLALMFLGVSHLLGAHWEIGLTAVGVSVLLIAHLRNMTASHAHG